MDTSGMGSRTMQRSSLAKARVSAVLRVEDIERAKRFYSETLGLEVVEGGSEYEPTMVMAGEGTAFAIYARPGMPAPSNTTLAFTVPDFDGTMKELRERGVRFEDYDIPEIGLKTEDGVAMMDGYKSAWFLDTEGNILSIGSM